MSRARWWRGSLFFSTLLHLVLLTAALTSLHRERAEEQPEIVWEIATLLSPDEVEILERLQSPPLEEPAEEAEPEAPEFVTEMRPEPEIPERPVDCHEREIEDEHLRMPDASMPMPPRIEMPKATEEAPDVELIRTQSRPSEPAVVTAARPRAGSTPAPRYPRLARRKGWEGFVTLAVEVAADGSVLRAAIASSSGHDQLDEAALAAVLRWRFEPGRRDGRPVSSRTDVTIEFRLR